MLVNANVFNFVTAVAKEVESIGESVSIHLANEAILIESNEVDYSFKIDLYSISICKDRFIGCVSAHIMARIAEHSTHLYFNHGYTKKFEIDSKQKYIDFIERLKKLA